jgi:hypothetical protein
MSHTGKLIMQKVEEYLRHAAECRDMARTVPPDCRQQLVQMARAWERLAQARKDQLDSWNRKGLLVEFVLAPEAEPQKPRKH